MADEAEKLINLSLCKMAESRTIRRGGTSLHKHLLISTVLTKARSAYFETWYMGDEPIDSSSDTSVDMNSRFGELDFPLDDDEDSDELDLSDPSSPYYEDAPSRRCPKDSLCDPSAMSNNIEVNDEKLIDPRFFVEVETENESEIELPSDILNCVEKMGDISDMSFAVDESASPSTAAARNVMVVSNVLIEPVANPQPDEHNSQLVYLDLSGYADSNREEKPERSELDRDEELIFGSPSHTSTPRPNAPKRRRNWSLDEDDSEDDDEKTDKVFRGQSSKFHFCEEISNTTKQNGVSKRLRFSPANDDDDSGVSFISLPSISELSPTPSPITMSNEFRTKKSHFDDEEDEQEDSDDDPFLGEALGQSPYDPNSDQILQRPKNDQRVPSASGGSSSDEDGDQDQGEGESSMEVDQITNLVQFISFNKHQPQLQSPLHLPSSPSSVTSTSVSTCGPLQQSSSPSLVRSMSSPDLCGLASSTRCVSSSSTNNAKDIFACNRNGNHNPISHHVITMTV